jgi:Ser/Thr protein kinase RdoA (MazF antagonist)
MRGRCYIRASPAPGVRWPIPTDGRAGRRGRPGVVEVRTVEPEEIERAIAAARSTASALGLPAEGVTVVQNSNMLALRLVPCDAFARVAHKGQEVAQFEIDLARRLAETDCPVAALEPRVEPRAYERDGFVITLWTYYESVSVQPHEPVAYANALARLHAGMRTLDLATPHFTDRVAEAQHLVTNVDLTPALGDTDRELLAATLQERTQAINDRNPEEQLLHGEPHPGNVLATDRGLRFVDLETCCRGPVEFDLAHVPEAVSARYRGADPGVLLNCRGLVLAMVAAWRWDRRDQFPERERARRELLRAIREGPPWPTLDAVMSPRDGRE